MSGVAAHVALTACQCFPDHWRVNSRQRGNSHFWCFSYICASPQFNRRSPPCRKDGTGRGSNQVPVVERPAKLSHRVSPPLGHPWCHLFIGTPVPLVDVADNCLSAVLDIHILQGIARECHADLERSLPTERLTGF